VKQPAGIESSSEVFRGMSKLSIFFTGILLGCFMTLYHVRSETIRELDLGPQTGHVAADNDEDWSPCEDMARLEIQK
jgi:hypothetical protein